MEFKDPITNILNEGWDEKLTKHSKLSVNHIAKQMIPDLYNMAQHIQLENETEYSVEELVNFGYVGLVSLITAQEKLNFDRAELLEHTNDFLNELIVAEKQWQEFNPLLECEQADCLGKECPEKVCHTILPEDDVAKEHAIIDNFSASRDYLAFLANEEKKANEKNNKVLTLDLYRKKGTK